MIWFDLLTGFFSPPNAYSIAKSEKVKNTIPYKYRTPEQVQIACDNQMKRNTNSKANAGSNIGNILLGMMMGMQEDWACDPLK